MLGADERDLQSRPARDEVRQDGEQLPVPLGGVDPADERDDVASGRAEQRLQRPAASFAVDGERRQPVVDDVHLAPRGAAEGLGDRLAHADDLVAAPGNRASKPAVPAEVVLQPDQREARAEGGDGADDRRFHAVCVHDLRARAAQGSPQLERREEHSGRPRRGRDHLGRHAHRAEALDERRVLERDDALNPVRAQRLEQRREVVLLAAESGMRGDERDRDWTHLLFRSPPERPFIAKYTPLG